MAPNKKTGARRPTPPPSPPSLLKSVEIWGVQESASAFTSKAKRLSKKYHLAGAAKKVKWKRRNARSRLRKCDLFEKEVELRTYMLYDSGLKLIFTGRPHSKERVLSGTQFIRKSFCGPQFTRKALKIG
jgi:hypothetical protein